MIKSFADRDAGQIFRGQRARKVTNAIRKRAERKLLILDAAENIQELRIPPGNHLKKLKADRSGQYSIRINAQWRICFVWRGGHAYEVEITDYHS